MDDTNWLSELEVHKEIKPENCNELGYEWRQDIFYDREEPQEAMQKIIDLVNSGKYVLGKSAGSMSYGSNSYGLYRKIECG